MRKIRIAIILALFIYGLCYITNAVFYGNFLPDIVNVFYEKNLKTHKHENKIEETPPHNATIVRESTLLKIRDEEIRYFKSYWILQHDMRTNYRKIMASCKDNMTWSPNVDRNPYRLTSAKHCDVTLDIQPTGQYSRVVITSFTQMNTPKTFGGDTWRIHVKGETSVSVTLVDNQDGTYEASFLIVEPGVYAVDLWLDYTLCDGFKDPPPDWFIKGNSQGKHQSPDTLPGYEKPFLEEQYPGNLTFEVKRQNSSMYEELKSTLKDIYPVNPCYMWDGFGRWSNAIKWKQYIEKPFKRKADIKHQSGTGSLWIFGDSIGDFLYRAISHRPLCNERFSGCNQTYNWVYRIKNQNLTMASMAKDNEDFSINRILDELKEVLTNPAFDHNCVLLLNYGLHYAMDIQFKTFEIMMNGVVKLLQEKHFNGTVIWKTTTAINKWRWGDRKTNARHGVSIRFFTTVRVELYNALTTSKMCEAGFHVLDVYPMSFAYPKGTRSKTDAVHFDHVVFKPVEDYLDEYFDN